MHSAFRLISVDSSSDPASCLFAAINELLRAVEGRVVLLRPLTACLAAATSFFDIHTIVLCESPLGLLAAACRRRSQEIGNG